MQVYENLLQLDCYLYPNVCFTLLISFVTTLPYVQLDQSMSTLFDYICTCLNKKLHKLLMYYFRI